MKKGWFSKARRKFLEQRVYSFTISEKGLFGSNEYKLRYDMRGTYDYCYSKRDDWYLDILNINGFSNKFLYAQELGKRENFRFDYNLKSKIMPVVSK